jgi:hypothetical protein
MAQKSRRGPRMMLRGPEKHCAWAGSYRDGETRLQMKYLTRQRARSSGTFAAMEGPRKGGQRVARLPSGGAPSGESTDHAAT